MRKKTILLLNVILLETFLSYVQVQESINGDNRCLTLDKDGYCSCCMSGFRGQTCYDRCEHCHSHLGTGQSCTYYCKTGYYGKTCDKPCPTTCASGISGPHLCTENNGFPFCFKCINGYYGKQCDHICDTNCLNRKCYKADGKCLNCISNEFYGDHCRLPCNQGCVSGTCNRTGHCTHGCQFGFYGERCRSLCGSNCQQGQCTSHGYHAYNCTEGCHGGYWGTSCLEMCPNHCTECEQLSGRCALCVENYVQEPETGECVKEKKHDVPDVVGDLKVIIIVLVVIMVMITMVFMIVVGTPSQNRRFPGRFSSGTPEEKNGLISKNNGKIRQDQQTTATASGSSRQRRFP